MQSSIAIFIHFVYFLQVIELLDVFHHPQNLDCHFVVMVTDCHVKRCAVFHAALLEAGFGIVQKHFGYVHLFVLQRQDQWR